MATNSRLRLDPSTLLPSINSFGDLSHFLRGSIAAFLRFWLARLVYEQKAQTDRVIDKLGS